MREYRIASESNRGLSPNPMMLTLTDAAPTYDMLPSDTVVIADTTGVTGDGVAIVTLPSMAEAVGQSYYVEAPTGATGGDLSLFVKETGAEYPTNGDMDADGDHLILFCTGLAWRTVLDGVA